MGAHTDDAKHDAKHDGDDGLPLRQSGKAAGAGVPDTARQPKKGLRLWRLPLVMAVLFTGAVVGMYFQPPALRAFFGFTGLQPGGGTASPIAVPAPAKTGTPVAEVVQPKVVMALGRLIPQGDTVTLALPYGAGDARIARLMVAEGDKVAAGQVIAELDSLPQLTAVLASAKANLAAKEAGLAQTRAAVASAYSEATANRDKALSAATLAEEEAARQKELFANGVISRAVLDRAEAAAVQAARALDQVSAQLSRQTGGENQPDVALAARQLDVARADVARAEGDLERGRVIAPLAGRVIALHVQAGEKPGAGGIATLGDTDNMQAELEVYQTDIARVVPGQSVTLTSPALTGALQGKVIRLGLEVERQSMLGSSPAANTDARIIRVTVALDADYSARAAALTGLEVTGRIAVEAQ
jgi:HlyD family secretion protein